MWSQHRFTESQQNIDEQIIINKRHIQKCTTQNKTKIFKTSLKGKSNLREANADG
jgi:hypothetical protein